MLLSTFRCVYVGATALALALVAASMPRAMAAYDYVGLREPKLLQSDCAKRWAELGSSASTTATKLQSFAGELEVNLTVQLTRFESDYVDFNTRAYNAQIPAPTIKVCPGDRLVINLKNELEEGRDNNTNLHVHGMHVPPVGHADNVMPNVEPGDERQYSYYLGADHPAGTFWYHPHTHGNVNSQLNGMMAGALIVADRPNDLPVELAEMEDAVLVLQAICVEKCHNAYDVIDDALRNEAGPASKSRKKSIGVEGDSDDDDGNKWPADLMMVEDVEDAPLNDTSLPTVYVNGQLLPSMELAAGEYTRLRVVNAIANNVAELVTSPGSQCGFHVLAMDGIYFDKPKEKAVVIVPPGGRADVAIMCPKAGTFFLETDSAVSRNTLLGLPNQHRVPSQRIVKLLIAKDAEDDEDESLSEENPLPSSLPARPSYLVDSVGSVDASADVDALSIPASNKYDYEFSVWVDKKTGLTYGVNHMTFNASYVNHSMAVGELQQWELSVNDYGITAPCDFDSEDGSVDRRLKKSSTCRTMNHPFHMHAMHFQVSGMDAAVDPDGVMFEVGEWRDTLPLYRSDVQIRFTPLEHMLGKVFTHCHIASHSDDGMGQLVSVYDAEENESEEEAEADAEDGKEEEEEEEEEEETPSSNDVR